MEETHGVKVKQVPGSHIFPLEYPVETADSVKDMIQALHTEQEGSKDVQNGNESGNWTGEGYLVRPY